MNTNVLSQEEPKSNLTADSISIDNDFILVTLNLLLIWFVSEWFNIEKELGLPAMMPIIFGAFLIHSFLPLRFRPMFFFSLSIGSILWLLGPFSGGILIGLAFLILGICHLPIALGFRKLILAGVVVLLGMARLGFFPGFIPSNTLAVLASIYMFRMLLYLFELKHEKEPVPIAHRVNYFFLLPNIIFPIFPIIDFKTFHRQYYNQPAIELYQEGIKRIVRGLIHLLAYRFIYLYLVPALSDVTDLYSLVAYLVFSYMTILRLSGLFHTVLGILFLFGYNLPEIFDNYFLANGFDDYWRRINIYWRDFILKIFYYPIYFKFKKFGMNTAIICSTLIIFVVNWFLHFYQWFWLLGDYSIKLTDLLFWGIFGLLVTLNIIWQLNTKKKRKKPIKDAKYFLKNAAGVMTTFSTIAILWSIWTSATVNGWWSTMSVAATGSLQQWLFLLGGTVLVLFLLSAYLYWEDQQASKYTQWVQSKNPFLSLGVLLLFSFAHFNSGQGSAELGNGEYSLSHFEANPLNRSDEEEMFNGYYEDILSTKAEKRNISNNLWQEGVKKEVEEEEGVLRRKVPNILLTELVPSTIGSKKGAEVYINKWGFRGHDDYSKEPPSGHFRFALIGISNDFGSGVENDETYAHILEQKMNNRKQDKRQKYEVLNFSAPGNSLSQSNFTIQHKVTPFNPDIVLLPIYPNFHHFYSKALAKLIIENKMEYLTDKEEIEWIEQLNISPLDEMLDIQKKISKDLVLFYKVLLSVTKKICEENQTRLILLDFSSAFVNQNMKAPNSVKGRSRAIKEAYTNLNIEAVKLEHIYQRGDEDMVLSKSDNHPNAKGHQLIADTLYSKLEDYLEWD